MPLIFRLATCLFVAFLLPQRGSGAEPFDSTRGDKLLKDYFEIQTRRIEDRCLADIQSADDWNAKKDEYRRQLQSMLGLEPWPERTPLQPVQTGTLDHDEFTVEKLHFQSLPGLYVTANLYVPKQREGKLPAILYVCGHARVVEDGISFGNKTGYQHHGAWYARSGYVCLIIDTIQLGEIEGIHHGTYREGMWWWNNRGYTPAGVEAWNGIRALDYLQSRDEVDPERIGITGRSGGGAYSWWVAALDERIKAAVPVAGITSMRNHVVDNCIEGHCDCMYMVNSEAWDFPLLAALVAPRPLLISNTDKDTIFPLDGVVDVYNKTRRIYKLLGAEQNIGLNIAEGPHKDLQELQVHAFRWMDRFLKKEDSVVELAARKLFEPKQLKVLETIPKDQRVTTIHESFVPQVDPSGTRTPEELREIFKRICLGEIVDDLPKAPLAVRLESTAASGPLRQRTYSFVSEEPYRLELNIIDDGRPADGSLQLYILTQPEWDQYFETTSDGTRPKDAAFSLANGQGTVAFFAPRGIGPTEWTRDAKKRVHIDRRFNLLGRTLDSARVWDTLQATESLREIMGGDATIELRGSDEAAGWSLHAALFTRNVAKLDLKNLSTDYLQGPYFLNISREATITDAVHLVRNHCEFLGVQSDDPEKQKFWNGFLAKPGK